MFAVTPLRHSFQASNDFLPTLAALNLVESPCCFLLGAFTQTTLLSIVNKAEKVYSLAVSRHLSRKCSP